MSASMSCAFSGKVSRRRSLDARPLLAAVVQAVGREPDIDDYRRASQRLREEGEDVQLFSRLYLFFGHSWPRAREALKLSGETSTSHLEARLRSRRLGRINRYTEDTLRATLAQAVEHYKRPPSTAEFSGGASSDSRSHGLKARTIPKCHPTTPTGGGGEPGGAPASRLHAGRGGAQAGAARSGLQHERRPLPADDLPVAVMANEAPALRESGLSADEAARVRETYEAMPRRTRYILTARLGLGGVPKQILRDVAEPLALRLTRIQQLQLYAQDALLQAAAEGRRTTRPGLRTAVTEGLRAMSERGLKPVQARDVGASARLATPTGNRSSLRFCGVEGASARRTGLELEASHADVAVQLGHNGGALVMSTYGHPSIKASLARVF